MDDAGPLLDILRSAGGTIGGNGAPWQLGWDGLDLRLETIEDLSVANEILVTGIYNFVFTRPSVVVDVGMHIGIAALYFGKNDHVERVYGFEPFAPTFAYALENLRRNPSVAGKVDARNVGLWNDDEELELDFCAALKGSTGVHGLDVTGTAPDVGARRTRREAVSLRRARDVLGPILDDARGRDLDVLVKVDCEGAEYEILGDLAEADLLRRAQGVIVEWHVRGAAPLVELLTRSGFRVISITLHRRIGFVFAVQ